MEARDADAIDNCGIVEKNSLEQFKGVALSEFDGKASFKPYKAVTVVGKGNCQADGFKKSGRVYRDPVEYEDFDYHVCKQRCIHQQIITNECGTPIIDDTCSPIRTTNIKNIENGTIYYDAKRVYAE